MRNLMKMMTNAFAMTAMTLAASHTAQYVMKMIMYPRLNHNFSLIFS